MNPLQDPAQTATEQAGAPDQQSAEQPIAEFTICKYADGYGVKQESGQEEAAEGGYSDAAGEQRVDSLEEALKAVVMLDKQVGSGPSEQDSFEGEFSKRLPKEMQKAHPMAGQM